VTDTSEPSERNSGPGQGAPPVTAGQRLRATMTAADRAAEEILESAQEEAREHVQRVENEALAYTAALRREASALLDHATELNRRAEALTAATRELTASMSSQLGFETDSVEEIEAPEAPALAAPATDVASPDQVAPPGEPAAAGEPAAVGEPAAAEEVASELTITAEATEEEREGEPHPPEPHRRRSLFARFRRRRESEGEADEDARDEVAEEPAAELERVTEGHRVLASSLLGQGLGRDETVRELNRFLKISNAEVILDTLQEGGAIEAESGLEGDDADDEERQKIE
jgi:hypothetical protein